MLARWSHLASPPFCTFLTSGSLPSQGQAATAAPSSTRSPTSSSSRPPPLSRIGQPTPEAPLALHPYWPTSGQTAPCSTEPQHGRLEPTPSPQSTFPAACGRRRVPGITRAVQPPLTPTGTALSPGCPEEQLCRSGSPACKFVGLSIPLFVPNEECSDSSVFLETVYFISRYQIISWWHLLITNQLSWMWCGLTFLSLLQSFGATATGGSEYDNPKVKPSASANAIYSLAARYV